MKNRYNIYLIKKKKDVYYFLKKIWLKDIIIKYHNKKLLNKKDNNKIFKRSLLLLKEIIIKYCNKNLTIITIS